MPKLVKKSTVQPDEEFMRKTRRIAFLASDKKAKDIAAYDVRGLTLLADTFVLCTVTSEPQLKAVYHWVHDEMKSEGFAPLRSEGAFQDGWLIIDYGEVIFHIFREKARTFYDMDGMWGDAPQIPLDIESGLSRKS